MGYLIISLVSIGIACWLRGTEQLAYYGYGIVAVLIGCGIVWLGREVGVRHVYDD